jgi:hypothetical protein
MQKAGKLKTPHCQIGVQKGHFFVSLLHPN